MPEMEEVYQKANYHKIFQVRRNTKAMFSHDRDILLGCKDVGKLQLVHYVHAET